MSVSTETQIQITFLSFKKKFRFQTALPYPGRQLIGREFSIDCEPLRDGLFSKAMYVKCDMMGEKKSFSNLSVLYGI